MMYFLRRIKWAYQRLTRGFDDRIKWSFQEYLEDIIQPLKEFCEEELKELNPENSKRTEIYTETLRLIADIDKMTTHDYYKEVNAYSAFWEYFGKNIAWYWN